MRRHGWIGTALMLAAVLGVATMVYAQEADDEYDVGGPLAGVQLPLFPTQRGETPGFPGCVPDLNLGDEGNAPVFELYPGGIEQYRAYMSKYMPIRPAFDQQSLLSNWIATNIPGAEARHVEEYAAPLYWVPRHAAPRDTGLKWDAATVIRCRINDPVIELDLGELEPGLYAVRVIGAVETDHLRSFRRPLYLESWINDREDGGESHYRLRLGYVDEFYSVAEIYFHAPETRQYSARITVGRGSEVPLLVHNITLDDVLAGYHRSAIKSRSVFPGSAPVFDRAPAMTREERLDRDATIWENFPPVNAQGSMTMYMAGDEHSFRRNVFRGADGRSEEEINQEFGAWTAPGNYNDPATRGVFLVNRQLGLEYTMDDLANNRPLPDPYPYKDDGSGLYYVNPDDPGQGWVWTPVADQVYTRIRNYYGMVTSGTDTWLNTGNPDSARDAAIALARYAYAFPTIDTANFLVCVIRDPGPYGREYRARRRETVAFYLPHYPMYVEPIMYKYDQLFDYIDGNQELAESIGRYIPWVETPDDVIKLIDVYFVQTVARRILRYQYHTDPMDIANLASVVGNTEITDPWMEWLFSRGWVYPLPVTGIQDLMISGCERDGCEFIGSTFYAQGEGALRIAASLDRYAASGGNPQYNLADLQRYPKPVAQTYWRYRNVVAGADFLRIGDVTGPDKTPGFTLRDLSYARHGWKWTGDPDFAFMLKHYVGRSDESDEEWTRIERAAEEVGRAPWLDNRSRAMPMWAGILETGLEHDDPRFRRAAYVRTGFGWGHHHDDTMDLQVVAHGIPATIDAGQRPGYSNPGDRSTRVHNVVEVNGRGFQGYSWVKALADIPGARYLHVDSEPPAGASLFRRQVALIDVHEGEGSAPLTIPQQRPVSRLPENVIPADSYVFDVFRVAGGKLHTYNFHGPIDDQFEWNLPNWDQVVNPDRKAGQYLAMFRNLPESKFSGTSPDTLEATWQLTRGDSFGNERAMLGANYNDAAPRMFTRLHLLDQEGALAMRANLDCFQWKYEITCLMVQREAEGDDQDSVFVALVEPFRGEPFIVERRMLDIADNEDDALKAVAVEVVTANGNRDVLFSDGRPEKTREIPEAGLKAAAEYAIYSTDGDGLRIAALTGGTLLEGPDARIEIAEPERSGRVVRADYLNRSLWIDADWPEAGKEQVFEIGVPGHWTTYTATRVERDGELTKITVDAGADYFRSQVTDIDPETGVVTCVLTPAMGQRPGIDKRWVASNDDMTIFWRADYLDNRQFNLHGAPVDMDAFGEQGVLRLWEYGVGDEVRMNTFASVRRNAEGGFGVVGNCDATISLPGGAQMNVRAEDLLE